MGFARNEHINQPGPGSAARGEASEAHLNGRAMGVARNEHLNQAGPGSEVRPSEAYTNKGRWGGEAGNRSACPQGGDGMGW